MKKEKIPCIICNSQLWEYIKPYLKEWEYIIHEITNLEDFPLLIINYTNYPGAVINTSLSYQEYNNRELVTNVEEFLERAAKLKGFTYKRKDIMQINGVEIKAGMVIQTKEKDDIVRTYVVFPLLNNNLGVIAYDRMNWDTIEYFITHNYSTITAIYDLAPSGLILAAGKLLWERPKEVKLTMQEIADKFGVPVEQLKIKK